jgi:putative transposase
MKRSRFREEQIIAILKEQEAGAKTLDVCRRHGISDATFYKWKAKYGGDVAPLSYPALISRSTEALEKAFQSTLPHGERLV